MMYQLVRNIILINLYFALFYCPSSLLAQQEADVSLPLYFKDANWATDTVYYLFDPDATNIVDDPKFGEEPIQLDSNRFGAYLRKCIWNTPYENTFECIEDLKYDSIYYKINAEPYFIKDTDFNDGLDMEIISLYNAQYPVTISFSPKIIANFFWNKIENSELQVPLQISGSIVRNNINDELEYTALFEEEFSSNFSDTESYSFTIGNNQLNYKEWLYFFFYIPINVGRFDYSDVSSKYKIYTTRLTNTLNLKSKTSFFNVNVKLVDLYGRIVYDEKINFDTTELEIELDFLPKGIYLVELFDGFKKYSEKIYKTN